MRVGIVRFGGLETGWRLAPLWHDKKAGRHTKAASVAVGVRLVAGQLSATPLLVFFVAEDGPAEARVHRSRTMSARVPAASGLSVRTSIKASVASHISIRLRQSPHLRLTK